MQQVIRLIHISLLIAAMTAGVWAREDAPPISHMAEYEYQRADTNFYPKAEFLRADPSAVIIPKDKYTQKGDSYFFTPRIRAPKAIYIEVSNDWIEPITPPDMPASLGVPPDAMQIREPQGDVQVALPSAPASFAPVTDGMTLPNGAVVKTGANGTAAVLFGGVDSARLMPNSAAAVQQTVTAQSRTAEVDLTSGGVFSKVGTQVGVRGQYEVHTPFGNAIAAGGDFATIIISNRVDIWVAQGTIALVNPSETKTAATVTSNGGGPLKILRLTGVTDPLMADVETFTAVLNFIPLADQKIKALHDKQASGVALTANEQAYLGRIKQVPSLIKLALVEPPAPAPAIALVTPAAPVPPPVKLEPIDLDLRPDGSVDFQNATLTLDELKPKLEEIAKATPTQPLVIKGREKTTHDQLKKVLAICKAAKLKKVTVAKAVPITPPPVAPAASEPAATNPPAPAAAAAPTSEPAATNPPAPAAAPAPATAPNTEPVAATAASSGPMRVVVRIDGKINFQKVTLTLAQFQSRLEAIIKATPDQAIMIKAGKKVPYEKFKAVLDICHSAQVKNLTVATPAPTPESAAAEPAATNLPAPALLMHPAMESPSSNASPEAPSAPPTTNAPPTAVP